MSGKQTHYLLPALPAAALVFARATGGGAPITARPAALPLGVLALAAFAAALGFAPGDAAEVFRPGAVMALFGAGCLGLAALALRARGGTAIAAVGLLTVALANAVFLLGAPGRLYDTTAIGELIAPSDAAGVGVIGKDYNGEFTFGARLRNPVAVLSSKEVGAWLAGDPGRALVARLDRNHPSGAPRAQVAYRGRPYGVWGGAEPGAEGANDAAVD